MVSIFVQYESQLADSEICIKSLTHLFTACVLLTLSQQLFLGPGLKPTVMLSSDTRPQTLEQFLTAPHLPLLKLQKVFNVFIFYLFFVKHIVLNLFLNEMCFIN